MKSFTYIQPTEIVFGSGRLKEVGALSARYGTRCLLVTEPRSDALGPLFDRAKESLAGAKLAVTHFDGVVPNPTTDVVSAGARMARESGAEVIVGLGGGSSMDTAKAIAVEATHEGSCWDYLFYKKPPTDRTLPIVCVTTTSGTGSQTTPCAVITKTEVKDKSHSGIPTSSPRWRWWTPSSYARCPRVSRR